MKKILKRIVLLIFIFSIYKLLVISFNTTLPNVDYRMYPTLELGDRLLVSKITRNTTLKREDIVCIKNNDNLPNPLRIIGLPNEEIRLEGNKIYINGRLHSDKKTLRDSHSYAFATKSKKFGFNPSSNYENIFGKP